MKKLLFIIGIIALVGCAGIEPATSYHFTPRSDKSVDIGKITYVIERNDYSIITVENLVTPIYIKGRLPDINIPSNSEAYLWKESTNRCHFVFDHRRYLIDTSKTEI